METGPSKSRDRDNAAWLAILGESPTVCIYHVCPYPSSTEKVRTGQSSESDTDCSSLANSIMVPRNIRSSHRKTTHHTETSNAFKESSREGSPPSSQQLPYLGGIVNIRLDLLKSGISQPATSFITEA